MRQIVKDWCEFCEKGAKFEDGYFYTLFMDGLSPDEINEIFKYFDQKDDLTDRMHKYLYRSKPQIDNVEILKDELRRLIVKDFEDRQKILSELECFKKFLANPEFEFISDLEHNKTIVWDDIWSQNFQDKICSKKVNREDKTYELYNSLYGITFDFDFQLYLFLPLLNTDYTGENIFEFKSLGGIYAISDNKVYYSFKK